MQYDIVNGFLGPGNVNAIGFHNLILNGTIRRWAFVGVGMALLKKCVTLEPGFEISYAQDTAECVTLLKTA